MKALVDAESWLSAKETAGIFNTVKVTGAENIAASADAEGYLKMLGASLPDGLKAKAAKPAEPGKDSAELEAMKLELELLTLEGGINDGKI